MKLGWILAIASSGLISGGCASAVPGGEGDNTSDASSVDGSTAIDANDESCTAPLLSCDDTCVDTDTSANHCGGCDAPCAGTCSEGECQLLTCDLPTIACGNACINPETNANFCGASGGCSGNAAGVQCAVADECIAGVCVCTTCGDIFEESFVQGQVSPAQCTSWNTYLDALGTGYSSVTMYGSNDMEGIACTDPTKTQQIANGLRNRTQFYISCDSHTWSFCNRHDGELWVDGPTLCDQANCPDPGYIFRVCWTSPLFGGVGTPTCSSGPSQVMGLRFQ